MNFNEHSVEELVRSVEAELAKSSNELRHAQDDLEKAANRLKFALAVVHNIRNRSTGE